MGQDFGSSLPQFYELRNPKEILDAIAEAPHIGSFLMEASPTIAKYFPGSKLVLEHTEDPEVPEWECLWVKVCIQVEVEGEGDLFESATRQLHSMDEWYLDLPYEVRKRLSIDIEPVLPKSAPLTQEDLIWADTVIQERIKVQEAMIPPERVGEWLRKLSDEALAEK